MVRNIRKSQIRPPATAAGTNMGTTLPTQHRRYKDLRDRLFYIAFALFFTALSVGIALVAPVLVYDCERDASGVVNCSVQRRLYGVIPLPAQRLSRVVSAEAESWSYSDNRIGVSIYWRFTQTYYALKLVCADGTRWRSFGSTEPIGQSMPAVAEGIQELLAAESPGEFHAWTGEKVPLLVGTVFLAPVMLILLALIVRILLFRG